MPKLLGLIAGLVVFCLWHRVIGNPHVVETIIGLVLAISAGVWIYIKSNKFFRKKISIPASEAKDNSQREDLPLDATEKEKTTGLIGELAQPGTGRYILEVSLMAIIVFIIIRVIR